MTKRTSIALCFLLILRTLLPIFTFLSLFRIIVTVTIAITVAITITMAVCHNAVSEQRANVPQMEAGTTAERGLQHTVGYATQTQVATARQSP